MYGVCHVCRAALVRNNDAKMRLFKCVYKPYVYVWCVPGVPVDVGDT